jgi:two-component system, NtrC family, response regulator AtoC
LTLVRVVLDCELMTGRDSTATDIAQGPGTDVLLVVGNGTFMAVELTGDLVIGRDAACGLVLDHRSLSRRHAILHAGPPTTLEDLDSHNGTRVGGALRRGGAPIPLAAGETFVIGPFSFVIVRRTTRELSASNGESLLVDDPTPTGVKELVREIARSRVNVLIVGETGVGKEVLAGTIHGLSERSGPYTGVNCAALSENLLESELFGHEKGSFTGATAHKVGLLEAANGGTVFLDEIGELSPAIQAKLLRAVEQREVLRIGSTRPTAIDVRFIAATNRDLMAGIEAGTFRRDLFFRLDGVQLGIRPLRERRGSIARLAAQFVDGLRAERPDLRLAGDAIAALERHDWPGNVRELKAVIERAALLARGGEILPRHLKFAAPTPSTPQPAATGDSDLSADERADRDRILQALDDCAGNQTRAAKQLGISRSALLIKLRLYRIKRPRS